MPGPSRGATLLAFWLQSFRDHAGAKLFFLVSLPLVAGAVGHVLAMRETPLGVARALLAAVLALAVALLVVHPLVVLGTRKLIAPALDARSLRERASWVLAALLIALAFFAGGTVVLSMRAWSPVHRVWLSLCDLAALTFVILLIATALARPRPPPPPARPSRLPRWLQYALPCAVVWTVVLLMVWPGLMSKDSLNQLLQVQRGHFVNHHPAFHSMLIWCVTRLWHSPAAVAVGQIAALSGVLGLGFAELERRGASRAAIWVAVVLTALSVTNSLFAVTLWKDVAYAIGLAALTVIAMKVVFSGGAWCNRRWHLLVFTLVVVSTAGVRHNGVAAAFGTLAALIAVGRGFRRPLLYVLVASVALIYAIQVPLYRALDVEPMPRSMRYEVPLFYLSAHLHAGSRMSAREQAFVASIPSEWIYNRYRASWTYNSTDLRFLDANRGEFLRTTLAISLRNPGTTLRHIIDTSALAWRITVPRDSFAWTLCEFRPDPWQPTFAWIDPNDLGQVTRSKLPALERWYSAHVVAATCSLNSPAFLLSWRSAQYLYLFCAAVLLLALARRQRRLLTLAAPIAAHTLAMAFTTISQDFRYHYPAYLLGWAFTLPLLSMLRPVPPAAPVFAGASPAG